MFFAEYIQKLHDCIEPETGRGDFTKKILELIVTNKKKVEYDSMSSYNGFYDGKTQGKGDDKKIIGDMICNCAKKSVDYLDVSEDKVNTLPRFKNYLKELRFNISAKKQLCDSFRCELPNINVDNYIDELSELLIKIIKEAAGKENTERTVNPHIESNSDEKEVPKSTTNPLAIGNHTEDNSVNITNTSTANINETFVSSKMDNTTLTNNNRSNTISIDLSSKSKDKLNELKALIEELSANLLNLNDKGGSYNCCSWILSKDEREEKKQEFEKLRNEFISKNEELRYYYLSFSELKDTFEKMIHISRVVKYGVYTIITEANDVMPVCDPEITEYEECIKAVWKALSK